MNKGLKKGLKIGGIILAALLLILAIIPFLFKDKIKDAVLNTANEMLNATVTIEDFGLNFFSSFPNATLSLDEVSIVGKDKFEKDTLLYAQSASVTIDLTSLFGNEYDISKISLDNASVLAKVLEDSTANWDIMKVDETATTEEVAEDSPFTLSMKKISLNNCSIVYDDQAGKMKVVLNGWNGTLSGDFTASETTLKTSSIINEISYYMAGVPYLYKIKGQIDAKLKANFDQMKFEFIDSNLKLNELKASIDGTFALVGEEGMDFDLKLNAPDTQFKDILSIMPAMYTSEFKNLKTSGTASLDAYIKGLMEGETYPAFDLNLVVADAMFQYPSLPKSVNDINLKLAVNSKGGSLDNTVVDLSNFRFSMGGNPFSGALSVTTPMSDANLKFHANGTIDLGMIKDVYPLEKGTELNGKIAANIKVASKMSAIEKEQYEKVAAEGNLKLSNMIYKAEDMPEVLIDNTVLEFTPRYVNLNSLDVKIGKNDISASGKLENFIAYALKDETLKGQLNIKSNYLNANDFISEETSGVATDSTATSEDIIIPKNIDFALNADLKQIVYGKINITNMAGAMTVNNGVLKLNNVSANALGGSAKVTGSYNTSNPKQPKVDFALNLANVSFAETFKSVESIQKFAPIFELLQGTYSMNLSFNTSLGQSILQTLTSLTGDGVLQTSNLKVENVPALTALASTLKVDDIKSFSTKDLNLPFSIKDGKVNAKPFKINMGNGGVLQLQGATGLDQTIDYTGAITLPKSMTNNFINNVPITIGGTFDKPKIGVDAKALAGDALSGLADKLLGGDKDKGDGEKSNVVEDTANKLAEEKAKQIQKLRDEAQKSSDKLVAEAEKQAKALEEKATNPIAKVAAKKAGEALVSEAKKQGVKLVDAAEIQAKKLEGETQTTAQ